MDWKKAVSRVIKLHKRYLKALQEGDFKRANKIEKQIDYLDKSIEGEGGSHSSPAKWIVFVNVMILLLWKKEDIVGDVKVNMIEIDW